MDDDKKNDSAVDEQPPTAEASAEAPEESSAGGSDEESTKTVLLEENIDYKDLYLRAVADYDNLKKETLRLRQEYAKYATGEVVEQMLPVLDNLKKALEHAPTNCEQWVSGIKLIREQFERVMEAIGVSPLGVVGEDFDPVKHEALLREKGDGLKVDTVVRVIEPGYKLHEKILRPAKVSVAE
ncbi:nucleotide exchange factor GrpE [Patescibacteria group bacterium]|nr:nucleotide exchange factor GrpE [Patescibacteria group bacterium]MBU1029267.1 nucleotide exchange factor GrpE [Patescibacteria group bacterium]MBU1916344.1 nucleotide exchange factor GrpE [Patescibacteria group bacterium]